MNGDFKTDITRDSYSRRRHFSRVLMQQGRVQLDADWNEQTDILLHCMRTLTADIIGPHAGPADDLGFGIGVYTPPATKSSSKRQTRRGRKDEPEAQATEPDTNHKVVIDEGRYYVDGLLCENDSEEYVYTIEDEEQDAAKTAKEPWFLLYLDVWEREVTYLEDANIREVALNGPDTATRAQIIWQVRTKAVDIAGPDTGNPLLPPTDVIRNNPDDFKAFVTKLTQTLTATAPDFLADANGKLLPKVGEPHMKAKTLPIDEQEITSPCVTPPSSQFRGEENQLYRVEVHTSGYGRQEPGQQTRSRASTGTSKSAAAATTPYATFKWSRENGSVVFPITSPVSGGDTLTVTVANLGRDDSRFTLHVDDWVEIVDYEDTLERQPGVLLRVTAVDYVTMSVSLAPYSGTISFDTDSDPKKQLLLRRWDYQEMDPNEKGTTSLDNDGALELFENHWLTLEDSIQVLFHNDNDENQDAPPIYYHTGDYWLIPARTATGDIEWPHHRNEHEALPPHGIAHRFAPIAYVQFTDGKLTEITNNNYIDLRREITEIWKQHA